MTFVLCFSVVLRGLCLSALHVGFYRKVYLLEFV